MKSKLVLDSIFHPTDFSPESMEALAHALKLALQVGAELRIFHVDSPGKKSVASDYPDLDDMLTRWGKLRGHPREATSPLIPHIRKIRASGNISNLILHHLEQHPANLMVLATRQHGGLPRWLKREVAERAAFQSKMITLFIPPDPEGFVDATDGQVNLRQILIPVTHDPYPQPAIDSACWLNQALDCQECTFTLLHIGEDREVPLVDLPIRAGWKWEKRFRSGNVVEEIIDFEQKQASNLICMMTQGHDDLLDEIIGNHTERVVRKARCPVLAIPTS